MLPVPAAVVLPGAVVPRILPPDPAYRVRCPPVPRLPPPAPDPGAVCPVPRCLPCQIRVKDVKVCQGLTPLLPAVPCSGAVVLPCRRRWCGRRGPDAENPAPRMNLLETGFVDPANELAAGWGRVGQLPPTARRSRLR